MNRNTRTLIVLVVAVLMIEAEAQTTPLSLFERENLIVDVLDELFGLGPLETLLKDRDISDILVNRHDQVFIERNGLLEETSIVFKDDRHLMVRPRRRISRSARRICSSNWAVLTGGIFDDTSDCAVSMSTPDS